MGGFVLRRAAMAIPLIGLSSFVVFCLVAVSGDPLGELRANPNVPPETIELRRQQLNLDEPLHKRYGIWLSNAVTGDFGKDIRGRDVTERISAAAGVTLRLVVGAVVVAVLLGVTIGVIAALRQYSGFDYVSTFLAFVFFSMPVFWLAAVLKDVGIRVNDLFDINFFKTVGEKSVSVDGGWLATWQDRLGHMVLPVLTLVLLQMAGWSRFQRGAMLEVLNTDYVRTAKAKGLRKRQVVLRHALRNALIPIVTLVAIDFGLLISGTVITETVYGWDGMGRLLTNSVIAGDVNVVQAWLLLAATAVVAFNLLADIVYGYLDPRIRHG
jgi:peptide/nickel transport system permease protein